VAAPGGLVSKANYDGAGRLVKTWVSDGGGDTGWTDAGHVTGDNVLGQVELQYDASSNPIVVIAKDRFHDTTATGELSLPASAPQARVSYLGRYYDLGNRLTTEVDVGTNGGSIWNRPATPPDRLATVRRTNQGYIAAGQTCRTQAATVATENCRSLRASPSLRSARSDARRTSNVTPDHAWPTAVANLTRRHGGSLPLV
jgi:hypothetical protein